MKLSYFEGVWRLERQITHADGTAAQLEGQAVWAPDGDGLIYTETGRLQIEGHAPMETSRRYLWREGPEVYFEDGRFFHAVPQSGEARHWCAPDDYRVMYRFDGADRFETTWHVAGPRKDYAMVSVFSRALRQSK